MAKTQRVLVTGGRTYDDIDAVRTALNGLFLDRGAAVLVHGAAKGADALCAEVWDSMGGECEAHPAQWDLNARGAGAIRNQEMLDSGVDLLISFPGGKGTADMTRRCRAAGVPIWMVGDSA